MLPYFVRQFSSENFEFSSFFMKAFMLSFFATIFTFLDYMFWDQ